MVLQNASYLIIQTADEILFHKIDDGKIDEDPFFSIQTPNPSSFISIDQQTGINIEALEEAYLSFNKIIE